MASSGKVNKKSKILVIYIYIYIKRERERERERERVASNPFLHTKMTLQKTTAIVAFF